MKYAAALGAVTIALSMLCGPVHAQEQVAFTAKTVNMRAGPARDYPIVAVLGTRTADPGRRVPQRLQLVRRGVRIQPRLGVCRQHQLPVPEHLGPAHAIRSADRARDHRLCAGRLLGSLLLGPAVLWPAPPVGEASAAAPASGAAGPTGAAAGIRGAAPVPARGRAIPVAAATFHPACAARPAGRCAAPSRAGAAAADRSAAGASAAGRRTSAPRRRASAPGGRTAASAGASAACPGAATRPASAKRRPASAPAAGSDGTSCPGGTTRPCAAPASASRRRRVAATFSVPTLSAALPM